MGTIKLPTAGDASEIVEIECESLVLVGGNGSGKSRLGIWIEDKHTEAHRISAQRSLIFAEQIIPRSTTAARSFYLFGTYHERPEWDEDRRLTECRTQKIHTRWGTRPESHLLDDFDFLMSLLTALHNRRNEQFAEDYKNERIPVGSPLPSSALDQTLLVWKSVMPQRHIRLSDNKLLASKPNGEEPYSGLGMSDGERVAFYLVGQAMCAPEASLFIVDEPEIHLHKAIQARLWDAIEAERSDCTFLYITHDLEFAASRSTARMVWVKDYDGKNWTWKEIAAVDGIPTELTLEILGSRKPVLFVEGTRDSIDTQLYRRIYPDFHVIARDGCQQVIETTIALRRSGGFHADQAFGIVDRDFRADEAIAGLRRDGIYSTPVAEAENAMCLPCIVKAAAKHLKRDASEVLAAAKEEAFKRLTQHLGHQIKERAQQEIRHSLSQFSSRDFEDRDEFVAAVSAFKQKIDEGGIYDEAQQRIQKVVDAADYDGLLIVFNNKGLEDAVAQAIGFSGRRALRSWVLAELDAAVTSNDQSEIGQEMLNGLREVFPRIEVPSPETQSEHPNEASSEEIVGG